MIKSRLCFKLYLTTPGTTNLYEIVYRTTVFHFKHFLKLHIVNSLMKLLVLSLQAYLLKISVLKALQLNGHLLQACSLVSTILKYAFFCQ